MPTKPDPIEQQHRADMVAAIRRTEKRAGRLESLRAIVATHSMARLEGLLVDVQTANMLVQVHDALNDANREKFLGMKFRAMVAAGWTVVAGLNVQGSK